MRDSENLIFALLQFNSCAHGGGSQNICRACAQKLNRSARQVEDRLLSAAQVSLAISECALTTGGTSLRQVAEMTARVIQKAMEVRINYFRLFYQKQNQYVRQHNSEHQEGLDDMPLPHQNWLREAARTGEVFPGRREVRPRLHFGKNSREENTQSCHKHYTTSNTHSPGIFTVRCGCSNLKLLGISVMLKCEGVSTALSVLLSRFRRLPLACIYDNACNMGKSIVLRVPWVNEECTVVCDRFHYRSHSCNSTWDPDSYSTWRNLSSSSAESINHLWNFSKSHLRFLKPENLMPFLATRSVFMNVRTQLREKDKKNDITARRFREFVQKNGLATVTDVPNNSTVEICTSLSIFLHYRLSCGIKNSCLQSE